MPNKTINSSLEFHEIDRSQIQHDLIQQSILSKESANKALNDDLQLQIELMHSFIDGKSLSKRNLKSLNDLMFDNKLNAKHQFFVKPNTHGSLIINAKSHYEKRYLWSLKSDRIITQTPSIKLSKIIKVS